METYQRNNEELKQLAIAKDNFVASLSHEMRTPLNGVLGMLQLALMRSDPDEKDRYIEKALAAGALLTGLLDDTLDLTRLEHGRAILNLASISLPALARSCIELVQPTATP